MSNISMKIDSDNKNIENKEYTNIVIWISLIAALGGLLFGLDQGFIANSLSVITQVYNLDIHGAQLYAASLATGGVLGALFSGIIARFIGRKKGLILAGFIFSALSILSATLPTLHILIACRFGLGFAVGIASFIVPLYLSETAPVSIRGSMGTLFQLMITIGIFVIAVTNITIAKIFSNPHIVLPLMFLVIALFAIMMFIGSCIIPESPRWLMIKNRPTKARQVLQRIFINSSVIERELQDIQDVITSDKASIIKSVFTKHFFKILIMAMCLQMFQQLVGINLIIYYAPTVFGYAGMTGLLVLLAVPTTNMLFTFPAIKLVEKWGRKKLLYAGSVVMMVSLLIAGTVFYYIGKISDVNQIPSMDKIILLSSIIIYILGFSISWGPVAWIICSEVFPLEGREVGMTITTMINWTFAGLVMGFALSFMHAFGNFSILFMFAGFCLLSILFLKLFVPETKGISLEELEMKLKSGIPLRNIGK